MAGNCSNCGALNNGTSFCANCGTPVFSAGETTQNPGVSTSKIAALWCHLGSLLAVVFGFGFLAWLPALLIRQSRRGDYFVDRHAVEAMNFVIQWLILFIPLALVGVLTLGLGFVAFGIFVLVVQIMASVAASNGTYYNYPLMFIRVIK